MKCMPRLVSRSGFSLVEVLIGALVLFIGVYAGLRSYVSNLQMAKDIELRDKAWAIAIQEMEGIKRVPFSVWVNNYSSWWYRYRFKGIDDDGNYLKGKNAIVWISDNRIINWWDHYKKENFDPMGLEEGWVFVYFSPVKLNVGSSKWALNVRIAVVWRDGKRIYGGDRNFNGWCNGWVMNPFTNKLEHDRCVPWMHYSKVMESPVILEGEISGLF